MMFLTIYQICELFSIQAVTLTVPEKEPETVILEGSLQNSFYIPPVTKPVGKFSDCRLMLMFFLGKQLIINFNQLRAMVEKYGLYTHIIMTSK